MPQVSLYLDDITMADLRTGAGIAECSLSKYVADVLREHSKAAKYPSGYFDLYGSLSDIDINRPADIALGAIAPLLEE